MAFQAELVLRLVVAAVLGAAIGVEREWRAKEAGLRTHQLVALGACLFMVVSQYGFNLSSIVAMQSPGLGGSVGVDVSRVAAQIVSGVGFLGAGVIVLHKQFVVGLTTAASIWTTAAIGVAVGGGLYAVATAAAVLTLFGLEFGRVAHQAISRARRKASPVSVEMQETDAQQRP